MRKRKKLILLQGGTCQRCPPLDPPMTSDLEEVRVQDQYFLPWLTLETYVNEMLKVQNFKIFCNLSLTSMVHEGVMFCAVILTFLVMICALMVLLVHIIIETDES